MNDSPFNNHSFQKFLSDSKIMGTRCRSCGAISLPPAPLCSKCMGSGLEWIEISGTGILKAFTCIAVGPPWMMKQGYNRQNPYCCGVVELDDGPRVVGLIEGVDTSEPATIMIGMPVQAKFREVQEGEENRIILAFESR